MSEMTSSPALAAATEHQPAARVALEAAVGSPHHAYLFVGPRGTGKREAARAFAAEILAAGAPDPEDARRRALADPSPHPDLVWLTPPGTQHLVEEVRERVIRGAAYRPFEGERRAFVIEAAETMADESQNALLKTLEEPPPFVHLMLLSSEPAALLETVVSRCQLVRFDPLPAERIAAILEGEGVDPARAGACGRLALGNLTRARWLASPEGEELRDDVERMARDALAGEGRDVKAGEPWLPLLERAEGRRREAEEAVAQTAKVRLEDEPKGRERSALEKEFEEAAKRDGRRARTEVLDLGLELLAVAFRDLVCVAEGAQGAVLGTDRVEALAPAARGRDARRLRQAVERCEQTRLSLELNVTEDLALSALTIRLRRLVGSAG